MQISSQQHLHISPDKMFNLQHKAFLQGIKVHQNAIVESPSSVFNEEDEIINAKKNWENFMEGDSSMEFINGLSEIFITHQDQKHHRKDRELLLGKNEIVEKKTQYNTMQLQQHSQKMKNLNLNSQQQDQQLVNPIFQSMFQTKSNKIMVKKQMVQFIRDLRKDKNSNEEKCKYSQSEYESNSTQANTDNKYRSSSYQSIQDELQQKNQTQIQDSSTKSRNESAQSHSPFSNSQANKTKLDQNRGPQVNFQIQGKKLNFEKYKDNITLYQKQSSRSISRLEKRALQIQSYRSRPTFTRLYIHKDSQELAKKENTLAITTPHIKSYQKSLIHKLCKSTARAVADMEDKICKEQLSEDTIASPNYRPCRDDNFNKRKMKSFNSPHRISEAAKKLKHLINRIDINGDNASQQMKFTQPDFGESCTITRKRELGTMSFLKRCTGVIKENTNY